MLAFLTPPSPPCKIHIPLPFPSWARPELGLSFSRCGAGSPSRAGVWYGGTHRGPKTCLLGKVDVRHQVGQF